MQKVDGKQNRGLRNTKSHILVDLGHKFRLDKRIEEVAWIVVKSRWGNEYDRRDCFVRSTIVNSKGFPSMVVVTIKAHYEGDIFEVDEMFPVHFLWVEDVLKAEIEWRKRPKAGLYEAIMKGLQAAA